MHGEDCFEEYIETSSTMGGLASVYHGHKHWSEAEELKRRLLEVENLGIQVLETAKKVLDAGHPHTLTAASDLVVTSTKAGGR
ncbi:hypothetical protein BDV97DRAFT_346149 [Delphinella strobiligena]|nr:hypothetical protein BDV97DRAFT_346149 [Delphinella strobiligena]